MTPVSASPAEPPGRLTSLRAGVNAGAVAGLIAMTVEGALGGLGVDPSMYVYQAQKEGLLGALELGAFASARGLGLVQAWLIGYASYCGAGMALGAVLGTIGHRFLRGSMVARYERLLGVFLGAWLSLMAIWWSRQLVLQGAPFLHPGRLALAGGLLVAGQFAGASCVRLRRHVPRTLRLATALGVLLLTVAGLYFLQSSLSSSRRGILNERNRDLPNVLLVVVDALRHDLLGYRGDPSIQTPHLDRLASEGVVFTHARAQAPFTWTSFGSLLTGKRPGRHGLIMMEPGVQMGANRTLASLVNGQPREDGVPMQAGDFATAAFMTGTVSQGSGLLQGFDAYTEALVGHGLVDLHDPWSEFRARLVPWLFSTKVAQHGGSSWVVDEAVDWIREHRERRFLAMVHLYSTHTDYTDLHLCDPSNPAFRAGGVGTEALKEIMRRESPADPDEARFIRNAYRGGVEKADADIGLLLGQLEGLGLLDETIVVVLSDHGESLGEHSLWEHNWMYEDNLRIPLLIRYPARLPEGLEVDSMVEQVDLVPTVLELMGLAPVESGHDLVAAGLDPRSEDPAVRDRVWDAVDGRSLVPLVREPEGPAGSYSISQNGPYQSITDGRFKLIVELEGAPARAAQADGFTCGLQSTGHPACSMLDPDHWRAFQALDPGERPRWTLQLYDLEVDPAESQNLALLDRSDLRVVEQGLWEALVVSEASLPIRSDLVRRSPLDAELDLFKALGYGGDGE